MEDITVNTFPARYGWALGLLTLVLVVSAAAIAYDAGLSNGLAQSAVTAGNFTAPPYAYGWHRPWGGFFPFFPLLFVFFWIFLLRAFWWGGGARGRWRGYPPYDRESFDEWHRRAHDQMKG
jgi:hypothetical protein